MHSMLSILVVAFASFLVLLPSTYADETAFPVVGSIQCGKKTRNSVPKAMGFSRDGKTLGIWQASELVFVDAKTLRELRRTKVADKLRYAPPYNYVAFEATGAYCSIATVRNDGFTLQFFDVERGLASETYDHLYDDNRNWTLATGYKSTESFLPLKQVIAFEVVDDKADATCEVDFLATNTFQGGKIRVRISFNGNSRQKKAEKHFADIGGAKTLKAKHEFGYNAGVDLQVSLSLDQKILLTQFVVNDESFLHYRFRFYDTESKEQFTQIEIPTGVLWRNGVSRGFAFSPDFQKLARSVAGGQVFLHDLSAVAEGIDGSPKYVVITVDDTPE